MQKLMLISAMVALILTVGCGKKDLDQKIEDNAGKLEKLERDLDDVAEKVDSTRKDMSERMRSLEKSMNALAEGLKEKGTESTPSGEETTTPAEEDTFSGMGPGEEVEPIDDREDLGPEDSSPEDPVREETRGDPNEPAMAWETMANPAQLSSKLDDFRESYVAKFEGMENRIEFEADIENFRTELETEQTVEELQKKYRTVLIEAMRDLDEGARDYYRRQLQALDEATGRQLEARVNHYRRMENMQKLSGILKKYDISADEVRAHGLIITNDASGPNLIFQ